MRFKYRYKATANISCKKAEVWQTLTNLDDYPLWNPFTIKVETDWKLDAPVLLTVQMKAGKKPIAQKEYLRILEAPNQLGWGMNWGPFLKALRTQVLREETDGSTTYTTEDVIEGPLSPIVHKLYGMHIQAGFDAVATGLKKHLEVS